LCVGGAKSKTFFQLFLLEFLKNARNKQMKLNMLQLCNLTGD